mmetsp:Transcript_1181/g.2938  ORF Transcript_1181/g.2938 Transcript_1181/m.2938 type:complete len:272 (+) Transcript_1181:344-1159(+)
MLAEQCSVASAVSAHCPRLCMGLRKRLSTTSGRCTRSSAKLRRHAGFARSRSASCCAESSRREALAAHAWFSRGVSTSGQSTSSASASSSNSSSKKLSRPSSRPSAGNGPAPPPRTTSGAPGGGAATCSCSASATAPTHLRKRTTSRLEQCERTSVEAPRSPWQTRACRSVAARSSQKMTLRVMASVFTSNTSTQGLDEKTSRSELNRSRPDDFTSKEYSPGRTAGLSTTLFTTSSCFCLAGSDTTPPISLDSMSSGFSDTHMLSHPSTPV